MRLSLCLATALELGLLGAIVAGLYWTGSRAAAWAVAIGRPGFDWRVLTATPLGTWACLLYAPLILVLATGKGALAKVLATRNAVALGESSYSLYMLHVFMLMLVPHSPQWFANLGIGYRVAVVFPATIGAAWVLWRFFERPSRQWLLRHPPRSWRPQVTQCADRVQG